ncbi:MAG: cation:proton antiporter [Opitutales bacterium]
MSGYAILLLVAALAFGLSKLVRLPVIPLLMLGGVGLQFLADALQIEIDPALVRETIELGLAVLVFTAGADLSPRRVKGRARPVLILAFTQFLLLGLAGSLTARWLGYDWMTAFYIGSALSASSTLVVVRHLQQRRQFFEPFGRLVVGVLLMQDVFIILVIVGLQAVAGGPLLCATALLKALALGAAALLLHRRLIPWVCGRFSADEETLMLGALATLFTFSAIAYLLDLPYLVGAFLAGFVLSAFPMNGLVRGMLHSLTGFFLALFFISIGFVLTLPTASMAVHGLVLILVLIFVTVLLVTFLAERLGYSTRAALEAGILLSQTSEFSLLLAFFGMSAGHLSPELFSMLALITVGTMTLTPLVSRDSIAWRLMKLHPKPRYAHSDTFKTFKDHAVLLGYGRAGRQTVQFLIEHGLEVVVVDDDASVVRQLRERGNHALQGDGSDARILQQVNAREARVVLCSMRRSRDARVALETLRGGSAKAIIRTFEPTEAEKVRARGGIPVDTAQAATDNFLTWLESNALLD